MSGKHPSHFVFKLFTRLSGPAGTAEYDMNTDSDATASIFQYIVPVGQTHLIQRINFQLVDASVGALDFGGINGGLTNGLSIGAHNKETGLMIDFLDGMKIKFNTDFSLLAGADIQITELTGEDQLPIRWTIAKAGAPFRLQAQESLRITINDDLSPLDIFRAMVQGVRE